MEDAAARLWPTAPLVEGIAIKLADGKDWIVPPLRLDQLVEYLPMLQEFGTVSATSSWAALGEEKIKEICRMICDAMRRNYPDLTEESLLPLLDLRTLGLATAATLNQVPVLRAALKGRKADG